jgi:hypothetical protein
MSAESIRTENNQLQAYTSHSTSFQGSDDGRVEGETSE